MSAVLNYGVGNTSDIFIVEFCEAESGETNDFSSCVCVEVSFTQLVTGSMIKKQVEQH